MKYSSSKKAQFYLLTSIILIVVMYGMVQTGIDLRASITEKNLKDLYELEAVNIINNALYESKNVTSELDSFTNKFIDLYDEKNQVVGVVYIYKDSELHVKNFGLDARINGSAFNSLVIPVDSVTITINDINYEYSFNDEPVEFKSLMVENEI